MKFKLLLLLLLLQCRTTGRFPPSSTYLWQVWSCLSVTWFLTSVMMLFITRMLYILVTLETRWKRLLRWVRNESVSTLIKGKNKILFFQTHVFVRKWRSGCLDMLLRVSCPRWPVQSSEVWRQRSVSGNNRHQPTERWPSLSASLISSSTLILRVSTSRKSQRSWEQISMINSTCSLDWRHWFWGVGLEAGLTYMCRSLSLESRQWSNLSSLVSAMTAPTPLSRSSSETARKLWEFLM